MAKFGPQRFDKYNLTKTRLTRLETDIFYILSKDDSYTEEKADALLANYLSKIETEEQRRDAQSRVASAQRAAIKDGEYTAAVLDTIAPVYAGKHYDWKDHVDFPDGAVFEFMRAIPSGSWDEDPKKMRQQIAQRWVNNTLRLWCSGHPVEVSFRLR